MRKTIYVWRWEDAPEQYRKLSEHGGDEDWLAFVPATVDVDYCRWLSDGYFGNDVSTYPVDGGTVYISAHA